MKAILVKFRLLFFLTILLLLTVRAKSHSFVYIQTENKQPFYIKLDKKLLNTSATGYIIMPKLRADTTVDEFARVLAEVVNDPSIAQAIVEKNVAPSIVVSPETKNEEVVVLKQELGKEQISVSETAKPKITRLMNNSTAEGLLITYLDAVNTGVDTVKIFIPVTETINTGTTEKQTESPVITVVKADTIKTDSRFINMELQNPNAKIDAGTVKKDNFVITEKKATLNTITGAEAATEVLNKDKGTINLNCKKAATQNDFQQLRKKMAAETGEKDMQKAANKQFIKTCFSTQQIKNLGVLFITEEEKYKFYIAAFPFVSDTQNYKTLEDQLSDNYYKTRFKSMFTH